MEHYYQTLPGFTSFEALYQQQVDLAPNTPCQFVELGTCAGRSAAFLGVAILNSGKPIQLDTWDTWVGVPKAQYQPGYDGARLEEIARRNLEPVAECVTVRTGDAIEAASQYNDGTVQFVFVDDDHGQDHVRQELEVWTPKLVKGGLLAGHDWCRGQIQTAVNSWAKAHRRKVYVSGKQENYWMAVCG